MSRKHPPSKYAPRCIGYEVRDDKNGFWMTVNTHPQYTTVSVFFEVSEKQDVMVDIPIHLLPHLSQALQKCAADLKVRMR